MIGTRDVITPTVVITNAGTSLNRPGTLPPPPSFSALRASGLCCASRSSSPPHPTSPPTNPAPKGAVIYAIFFLSRHGRWGGLIQQQDALRPRGCYGGAHTCRVCDAGSHPDPGCVHVYPASLRGKTGPPPSNWELCRGSYSITESGGPGEELPCSTVALASIEPAAKSSLDRVRCGAAGRIAPPAKKNCAVKRKNRDFNHSTSHLMAPEHRICWWPGGYGVPSIRRGVGGGGGVTS